MEKTIRTVIGGKLQTAQKLNRPYEFAPNSIMNKVVGVLPDALPGETPWTQYAAIGIGGLSVRYFDNNTRATPWPQPHEPTDTGMFRQVPYVMRPVNQGLTAAERSRFRLRTIETRDGVKYECWWLRPLDLRDTTVRTEYRQIVDGQVVSTPWEPSAADQHPTPRAINPNQVLVTGDDYVASTAKTTFRFNSWDMTELVNVGSVLFKDEQAILLTELAACSGVDFESRGDFNGIMLPYTEAIGVQITDFVSTFLPSAFNRAGASINMDIGSVEPLFKLATAPATTNALVGTTT